MIFCKKSISLALSAAISLGLMTGCDINNKISRLFQETDEISEEEFDYINESNEYTYQAPDYDKIEINELTLPITYTAKFFNPDTYDEMGSASIKINSVEVFNNLNKANIDMNLLYKEGSEVCYSDFQKEQRFDYFYPYYFDGKTGQLIDGAYLFVYETEITSIDAQTTAYDENHELVGTYNFDLRELIDLKIARHKAKVDIVHGSCCYGEKLVDDKWEYIPDRTIELKPGEKVTLRIASVFLRV